MTTITLHDNFAGVGETWKLAIKSVSEALHSINILSGRRLYKFLAESDKRNECFKVIVNGETFSEADKLDPNNLETIKNSELAISRNNIKTIEIVRVISGGDSDIGQIILGALLIIVGIVLIVTFGWTGVGGIIGVGLILAGIGLAVGGIINLLTSPPSFDDFREIDGGKSRVSYLFNGPTQSTREGGPVPCVYGRIIAGSQVISASYETSEVNADSSALTA
jgi:predicted phage tail protein